MTKVWVVSSMTESGDEYTYVFDYPPTRDEILDRLFEDWPQEFGEDEDRFSDEGDWTINAPDEAEEQDLITL